MNQDDVNANEIERLKGEMSAACHFIALTIHMLSLGDPKLTAVIHDHIKTTDTDTIDNLYWLEGVERFKKRLLTSIPSDKTSS